MLIITMNIYPYNNEQLLYILSNLQTSLLRIDLPKRMDRHVCEAPNTRKTTGHKVWNTVAGYSC